MFVQLFQRLLVHDLSACNALGNDQASQLCPEVDLACVEMSDIVTRSKSAHHEVGRFDIIDEKFVLILGGERDRLADMSEACSVHLVHIGSLGLIRYRWPSRRFKLP